MILEVDIFMRGIKLDKNLLAIRCSDQVRNAVIRNSLCGLEVIMCRRALIVNMRTLHARQSSPVSRTGTSQKFSDRSLI